MARTLDYIFSNLDIDSLEHKKVMEYLCYLPEITPQVSTEEGKIKCWNYHLPLTTRLTVLDRKAFTNSENVLTAARPALVYTINNEREPE